MSPTGAPTRRDVELPGVGDVTLRGWYYPPEPDAPAAPGVVLSHGFSGVKEMALDRFAEVFAAAGLAVLVYDHRGLGTSDGDPRQLVDPWAQIRDCRRALDWLGARPEVDDERLALWGTSFSGGEALVVGAADRRVRAVVAQVPYVGDAGIIDADGSTFEAICKATLGDAPGPAEQHIGPMPVVTEEPDGAAMLPQPESWRWFHALAEQAPTWENEVTLVLDGAPAPFEPTLAAAHLQPTPLLMIVATDDRVADTEAALAAFARAGEPKRLETVVGDHFVAYHGDGFEQASAAARDFLVEVLSP
jgi:cephalosporin-C deacetylase-like acetyl esterase